jgi:hypothetical protein
MLKRSLNSVVPFIFFIEENEASRCSEHPLMVMITYHDENSEIQNAQHLSLQQCVQLIFIKIEGKK